MGKQISYGRHQSFRFPLRPDQLYTRAVVGDDSTRVIWRSSYPALLVLSAVLSAMAGPLPECLGPSDGPPAERGAVRPDSLRTTCELPCMILPDQLDLVRRFIDQKLKAWQQRLKLQNWNITVVLTRRAELKPKTLGGIRWDKSKKSAVLSVLDMSENRLPLCEMLDDIEFTIVHELVHLELASLPRSEASRSNEEQAVNRITEALLGLARGR